MLPVPLPPLSDSDHDSDDDSDDDCDDDSFCLRENILDGGKIITLDVKPSDTVGTVKDKIQAQEGIPKHKQDLSCRGVPGWLADGHKLAADRISESSVIFCIKDGL